MTYTLDNLYTMVAQRLSKPHTLPKGHPPIEDQIQKAIEASNHTGSAALFSKVDSILRHYSL